MALDMTTLTIMRQLPREVDPLVHNMRTEDPGDISYSSVGGLGEQIRELREVSERSTSGCGQLNLEHDLLFLELVRWSVLVNL